MQQARADQGPLTQIPRKDEVNDTSWEGMTYEELRIQCKMRSLMSTGRKQALVERLTEATGSPTAVVLTEPITADQAQAEADAATERQPAAEAAAASSVGSTTPDARAQDLDDLSVYKYGLCRLHDPLKAVNAASECLICLPAGRWSHADCIELAAICVTCHAL